MFTSVPSHSRVAANAARNRAASSATSVLRNAPIGCTNDRAAATPSAVQKKKLLEKVLPYLKTDAKGVELVRRDVAPAVKHVMRRVNECLMEQLDPDAAIAAVRAWLDDLVADRIPFDDYVLSKRLADNYATQDIAHVAVVKELQALGLGEPLGGPGTPLPGRPRRADDLEARAPVRRPRRRGGNESTLNAHRVPGGTLTPRPGASAGGRLGRPRRWRGMSGSRCSAASKPTTAWAPAPRRGASSCSPSTSPTAS